LLKLNVEQAAGVNVNKNLWVLNILSIKYSVYDLKCDINYCVYSMYCILCDMDKINIIYKILIKNLEKQKRWDSKKLLKELPSKG